ncbi:MAG: tetratricopeptide repeat protein [Chthoniobacterales bacterium]
MEEQRPSVLKPAIDPSLDMTDSDLFWQEHWRKVVWGLAVLVALILLVGVWNLWSAQTQRSAESLFSTAAGPEGWREVVQQFPASVVAGNAQMRLADVLRGEGNLDGAAAELEAMVASQPDHPLAGAAWLTLGEIRQVQGSKEAALEAFRTASSRHKESYAAPLALIAEASLLQADGSTGEARAVLQSVGSLHPGTPAAMVAEGELGRLGAAAEPASPTP